MSENFHEDIPDTPISDRDGENKSLPPDLSAAAQTRFEELTAEQQQAVLLRWRSEPEKNAKRFLAVLDRYENWSLDADEIKKGAEKTAVSAREDAREAAKEAQTHIAVIESTVGGGYQPAIRSEIQAIESGHADPETSAFLTSIGVDVNQPEALQVPEVQEIVRTRAAAKVYLSEPARTEMARHPELHAATEGLAGLRGKLGLTSTVPVGQVSHLLTDQPRTVRDRAAEITEAVTAGATAAKVSRVGNVLRLQDGDGTVSHEIELRDPPVLIKRVGVLEARRDIGQSPNENLHGEREVQRQVTNQIGRNLSTLGSETAQIHSWQATWATDGVPTLLDAPALSSSVSELSESAKWLPASAEDLRWRLDGISGHVHDAKSRAEEWIRAGGEHPYPEDLVEETRRRDLLEEPLRHLDKMIEVAERIATESRQLTDHEAAPATQTEIGQAARHFDQVATGNLSLLRDLGFDRWDSMDDVHTFLDYGQELARVRFGLSFPPDLQSGRVALGERPFGWEATVLVDELYQWLPTHAATDHAERYRAIRADLALGPDSEILRSYRRLKTANDGRFPSVASLMSLSGWDAGPAPEEQM